LISIIVEQKKPMQGEKGQYGYVRQPEEKQKKQRKRKTKTPDSSFINDEFIVGSSKLEGMGVFSGAIPIQGLGEMEMPVPNESLDDMHELMYEGTPCAGPSIPNASPAEEEMDEEGSEWAVRVGTSPPPMWGKRRASEEPDHATGAKRPRPKYARWFNSSRSAD
jgi:hypothetical protein